MSYIYENVIESDNLMIVHWKAIGKMSAVIEILGRRIKQIIQAHLCQPPLHLEKKFLHFAKQRNLFQTGKGAKPMNDTSAYPSECGTVTLFFSSMRTLPKREQSKGDGVCFFLICQRFYVCLAM